MNGESGKNKFTIRLGIVEIISYIYGVKEKQI
jgi:hypothetical protein